VSYSTFEFDELPTLSGRAWTFGDNIRCEDILPAQWHDLDLAVGSHAMSGVDPDFTSRVEAGDFVVAGDDFGGGRETRQAVRALRLAGVAAVVARSLAPEFFGTAIRAGLPALLIEETPAIRDGDRLRIDIENHTIANLSSGDRYVIRNLRDEFLDILRAGGLSEYLAHRRA
jgi:3-isopropylmalate/(R)-2-methylmalate dehydratase small subunit